MKRNLILCSLLMLIGICAVNAQTVLVNYDFASAVAGNPCTAAPLTTAPGTTAAFTTGGTGTGTCTTPAGTATTAPPAFVANAANQSVSLTSFAGGSSNYFQFQLTNTGTFQDYMLFFQTQRSGTGPVNAAVQYSTDGVAFTTFQTVNPGNGVFAAFNVDLSAVTAIENQQVVYFRILGTGGTGAGGTFRIDNFQVQAVVLTAAAASISGRVTLPQGVFGNPKVWVTLTDSTGNTQSVQANFKTGAYRFVVTAGETYILRAAAKGATYEPQVITAFEDLTEVNFAPLE